MAYTDEQKATLITMLKYNLDPLLPLLNVKVSR